jgi:hypothetical protein
MITILSILLAVSVLINTYQYMLYKGRLGKDKDKDFIPDSIERKARRVKKEIKDVGRAIKK